MAAPEKQLSPEDFFPVLKEDIEKVDLTRMTAQAQALYVKNMFSKQTFRRK